MKLQIRTKKVKMIWQVQTHSKYRDQQDFQRQEKRQAKFQTQKFLNIRILCLKAFIMKSLINQTTKLVLLRLHARL